MNPELVKRSSVLDWFKLQANGSSRYHVIVNKAQVLKVGPLNSAPLRSPDPCLIFDCFLLVYLPESSNRNNLELDHPRLQLRVRPSSFSLDELTTPTESSQ